MGKTNKPKITIRQPNTKDVVKLLTLLKKMGVPVIEKDVEYRFKLYTGNLNSSWIVEDTSNIDSNMVGWVAVSVCNYNSDIYSPIARVVSLVVDPDYRCLGIGKELLNKVEEYSKKIGCVKLELTKPIRETKEYSNFCEKLGFNKVPKSEHFVEKLMSN